MGNFQCRCGAPVARSMGRCPACDRVLEWGTLGRSANNIDWRNGLLWSGLFGAAVWLVWQVWGHG